MPCVHKFEPTPAEIAASREQIHADRAREFAGGPAEQFDRDFHALVARLELLILSRGPTKWTGTAFGRGDRRVTCTAADVVELFIALFAATKDWPRSSRVDAMRGDRDE